MPWRSVSTLRRLSRHYQHWQRVSHTTSFLQPPNTPLGVQYREHYQSIHRSYVQGDICRPYVRQHKGLQWADHNEQQHTESHWLHGSDRHKAACRHKHRNSCLGTVANERSISNQGRNIESTWYWHDRRDNWSTLYDICPWAGHQKTTRLASQLVTDNGGTARTSPLEQGSKKTTSDRPWANTYSSNTFHTRHFLYQPWSTSHPRSPSGNVHRPWLCESFPYELLKAQAEIWGSH